MPERSKPDWAIGVLSVVLALVVWLFVTWERPAERRIAVPLRLLNLPAGMTARGAPRNVEVTVCGPRLPVMLLDPGTLVLDLDLTAAGEGEIAFPALERRLRVPDDLTIVGISPARVEIRLEKSPR